MKWAAHPLHTSTTEYMFVCDFLCVCRCSGYNCMPLQLAATYERLYLIVDYVYSYMYRTYVRLVLVPV